MNFFKLVVALPLMLFLITSCSNGTSLVGITEEKGVNGGIVQTNDQYQVEMVVKDEALKLYVTHLDGRMVSADKVMATAMVAHSEGDFEVSFDDQNNNQLVAQGDFSGDNVKVVIVDLDVEDAPSDTLIFNVEATAAGPQMDWWDEGDEGH